MRVCEFRIAVIIIKEAFVSCSNLKKYLSCFDTFRFQFLEIFRTKIQYTIILITSTSDKSGQDSRTKLSRSFCDGKV